MRTIDMFHTPTEEWIEAALLTIRYLTIVNEEFTTDNVWGCLRADAINPPAEPRAMGQAMLRAKREGLVELTGRYVKTTRPGCHGRPIPVWRSRDRFHAPTRAQQAHPRRHRRW